MTVDESMDKLRSSFGFEGVPDGFDDWQGVQEDLEKLVRSERAAAETAVRERCAGMAEAHQCRELAFEIRRTAPGAKPDGARDE